MLRELAAAPSQASSTAPRSTVTRLATRRFLLLPMSLYDDGAAKAPAPEPAGELIVPDYAAAPVRTRCSVPV